MDLADMILADSEEKLGFSDDSEDEIISPSEVFRDGRTNRVPSMNIRTRHAEHMPSYVVSKNAKRCRNIGCCQKSRVECETCNVILCFTPERNCFASFHQST
ncbi:hypothetical protein M8J77_011450 [Diaphorina citri]|nr:hypothetical protein M8J77_011450 [Diaphorina citri]